MNQLLAFAPEGLGEVHPGDDLVAMFRELLTGRLEDGDIVVVASKIVAKAEGRYRPERDRETAIDAESVRLVAAREMPDGRLTRVVETRQGPVLAAAGVDASDVGEGLVLLLPADPDASARALRAGLQATTGRRLGVLVTDTSGRPWRRGVTDFCLGAAGVAVLDDRRGSPDSHGRTMSVTVRNLGDELACLADLVKGKAAGTPLAVVRGLPGLIVDEDGSGAAGLVRTGPTDWFGLGRVEAVRAALDRGERAVPLPSIDPDGEPVAVRLGRAVAVAAAFAGGEQLCVTQRNDLVEISGTPDFVRGRMVERLLTATHAEDLVTRDRVGDGQVRLRFVDSRGH